MKAAFLGACFVVLAFLLTPEVSAADTGCQDQVCDWDYTGLSWYCTNSVDFTCTIGQNTCTNGTCLQPPPPPPDPEDPPEEDQIDPNNPPPPPEIQPKDPPD